MVWYSYLFKNFPELVVTHTVKVFGVVNKAEIDVFLEQKKSESPLTLGLPCFPKGASFMAPKHTCAFGKEGLSPAAPVSGPPWPFPVPPSACPISRFQLRLPFSSGFCSFRFQRTAKCLGNQLQVAFFLILPSKIVKKKTTINQNYPFIISE